MYDIKAVIASFLRKLQQNFAQSHYFPTHTTKRRCCTEISQNECVVVIGKKFLNFPNEII
jgi:hypothetical protein